MRIKLTSKKALLVYMTGIAIAMGAASLLQNGSRKRLKFMVEKPGEKLKEVKVQEEAFQEKLKEKEDHLVEGRVEKLKGLISEKIFGTLEPKPVVEIAAVKSPKKKKARLEDFIGKAKVAKSLKDAVVEYISHDMEERLEEMGMDRERLETIVDAVAERTEEIMLSFKMEEILEEGKTLEEQVIRVIEAIRPELLKEIAKIKEEF